MKQRERTMKTGQDEVAGTSLQAGREAFERHAWRESFDLLTAAQASEGFSAEDLERLGDAAWLSGRIDDCIGNRERAYAAYLEAGNRRRAAFVRRPAEPAADKRRFTQSKHVHGGNS